MGIDELIEAMPSADRAGALRVLDELSRPLTVREIEHILRDGGVPKFRATKLAGALKQWRVIALVGPEEGRPTISKKG